MKKFLVDKLLYFKNYFPYSFSYTLMSSAFLILSTSCGIPALDLYYLSPKARSILTLFGDSQYRGITYAEARQCVNYMNEITDSIPASQLRTLFGTENKLAQARDIFKFSKKIVEEFKENEES
jgi:hypothetical protein